MNIDLGAAVSVFGTFVFVLIKERDVFDDLPPPVTDHGIGDHGGHVLTKTIEADGIRVIFQRWLIQPSLPSLEART